MQRIREDRRSFVSNTSKILKVFLVRVAPCSLSLTNRPRLSRARTKPLIDLIAALFGRGANALYAFIDTINVTLGVLVTLT